MSDVDFWDNVKNYLIDPTQAVTLNNARKLFRAHTGYEKIKDV